MNLRRYIRYITIVLVKLLACSSFLTAQELHSLPSITIDYLKNHPALVEVCARWAYDFWSHYTPHLTLDDYSIAQQEYLNDKCLPLTLIAFDNATPVGMCSLAVTRGMLPQLSPWLASLYVCEPYRNQGIGGLLERAICAQAQRMGYKTIYCFTSDKTVVSWYQKQGWHIRGFEWFRDHEVTVIQKQLH